MTEIHYTFKCNLEICGMDFTKESAYLQTNTTESMLIHHCNSSVGDYGQQGHCCHGEKHPLDFIPALIYVIILIIVGIPGNILVIYVYIKKWNKKKKSSTSFILSLAVLDFINCTITLPFETILLTNAFDFDSPVFCKILRTVTYVLYVFSGVLHIGIAIDRFIHVRFWLVDDTGFAYVRNSLIVGFVVSLLTCWPPPLLYGTKTHRVSSGEILKTCVISDELSQSKLPYIYGIYLLASNIVVDCILTVLYLLVGYYVYKENMKYKRSLKEHSARTGERKKKTFKIRFSNRKKADIITESDPRGLDCSTKMMRTGKHGRTGETTFILSVITLLYVITYIPFCVILIIRYSQKDSLLHDFLCQDFARRNAIQVVFRSYLLCMAMDPLVYCFLSNNFRKECKQLVRRSSKLFLRRQQPNDVHKWHLF